MHSARLLEVSSMTCYLSPLYWMVQDGKWLQLHHSELVKLGVQEVT